MEPKTGLEAKFSLTHCAAAALLKGPLYYDHFMDGNMTDPEIIKLQKKVILYPDTQLIKGQSRIKIILENNKTIEYFSDIYRADREGMSKSRLINKAKNILNQSIGEKRTLNILNLIDNLEQVENMADILDALG